MTFRHVVPKPSFKSVPTPVGSLVLPTLTSHLPGDVGPLDCLLGGRGRPSGAGQTAGLEEGLGPSRWPHTLVYKSLRHMCVNRSTELCELNTVWLSDLRVMASGAGSSQCLPLRAPAALQPCATFLYVPVQENLPTLPTAPGRQGTSNKKPILLMKKLRHSEVKPFTRGHMTSEWQRWTKFRAVCPRARIQTRPDRQCGEHGPGCMSWLCHGEGPHK